LQQSLLLTIQQVIQEYQQQGIKLTNRQLYYQLVAKDLIPNAQEVYKRLCAFFTDARYGGEIDWDAIEDRGRTQERHAEWNNVKDLVDSAVASYRLPRWKDQDYYVELYCEKQAMESVLKPIADKYHLYFGCNKGYSSASAMYELGKRLLENTGAEGDTDSGRYERTKEPKEAIILYLGDHDSSGLDMIRDITERIDEFFHMGETDYDREFTVVPVALTTEQVRQYNPPPNPAKMTDPRAKSYVNKYGNNSWELDALNPKILMHLTEEAIQNYLDVKKYNAVIEEEKEDTKALQEFADKLIKK